MTTWLMSDMGRGRRLRVLAAWLHGSRDMGARRRGPRPGAALHAGTDQTLKPARPFSGERSQPTGPKAQPTISTSAPYAKIRQLDDVG
jgi:hypothetical protein